MMRKKLAEVTMEDESFFQKWMKAWKKAQHVNNNNPTVNKSTNISQSASNNKENNVSIAKTTMKRSDVVKSMEIEKSATRTSSPKRDVIVQKNNSNDERVEYCPHKAATHYSTLSSSKSKKNISNTGNNIPGEARKKCTTKGRTLKKWSKLSFWSYGCVFLRRIFMKGQEGTHHVHRCQHDSRS